MWDDADATAGEYAGCPKKSSSSTKLSVTRKRCGGDWKVSESGVLGEELMVDVDVSRVG